MLCTEKSIALGFSRKRMPHKTYSPEVGESKKKKPVDSPMPKSLRETVQQTILNYPKGVEHLADAMGLRSPNYLYKAGNTDSPGPLNTFLLPMLLEITGDDSIVDWLARHRGYILVEATPANASSRELSEMMVQQQRLSVYVQQSLIDFIANPSEKSADKLKKNIRRLVKELMQLSRTVEVHNQERLSV